MSNEENSNVNLLDKDKYFQIEGRIVSLRDDPYNGTPKRILMFEDLSNPEYPNHLEVEFYGEKADQISSLKVGDMVCCSINIKGGRYPDKKTGEAKVFLKLSGWKAKLIEAGQAPVQQQAQTEASTPDFSTDLESDIPF